VPIAHTVSYTVVWRRRGYEMDRLAGRLPPPGRTLEIAAPQGSWPTVPPPTPAPAPTPHPGPRGSCTGSVGQLR
jgi:hypothetical protein